MEMHRKQLRLRRATQARTALLEPLVTVQREIIVAALLNNHVYVCQRRAQQLLLVKIQKLMCRGGREENESNRYSRVRMCDFLKMATETM